MHATSGKMSGFPTSADSLLKTVQAGVQGGDAATIGILVAVLVVLLTILIFACRGGSNKRRVILLTGLCDSGKTLLFSRLIHNRYVTTHTSIKDNSGSYNFNGQNKGSLKVIDLPGHERLRIKFFETYKQMARAVVFLIDSTTFQKDIKDVAEYMYEILSDRVVLKNGLPILVACNKHDVALAKGSKLIQTQLEKEMNNVRFTKSAALEGTATTGNSSSNTFLGRRDRDFQFADLKPTKLEFIECSVKGKKEGAEPDIAQLTDWLSKIA